ncbi:unnamed protein product [Boreogadus saida]
MSTRPWHGSVVISTALRNPSATLLESELAFTVRHKGSGSDFEALDWGDCEWTSVQRRCSRLPGSRCCPSRVGHGSQPAANPEPA